MPRQHQPFGSPYKGVWTATSEHYHAVSSMNQHGVIEHTRALAHEILKSGGASDEWQALDIARAQVQAVRQVIADHRLHQLARRHLEAEAAMQAHNSKQERTAFLPAV
jgi:hypothetical protein